MVSKVTLALLFVVAAAAAIPQPGGTAGGWGGVGGWGAAGGWGGAGANPWIPPWVATAPWYPQWTACTTIGASCIDCNTKLVCTKVGGFQRVCADPTLPYCNLGECSATPSAECAPETEAPATV